LTFITSEIFFAAKTARISDAAIRRAKNQLNIKSVQGRDSNGKVSGWVWQLPDKKPSPHAQENPPLSVIEPTPSPHAQDLHSEHLEHVGASTVLAKQFQTINHYIEGDV